MYKISIIFFLLNLFIFKSFAQDKEIHGFIDNKIVKINKLTGNIEEVILDINIPNNLTLVDLVYDETKEIYYSIANPTSTPKLVSISKIGEFSEIGAFSFDSGIVYSAESISINSNNVYISASLNGGPNNNDFYSESLLKVNTNNAECTFITKIETNRPFPDIDVMTFVGNELYFFDGAPPSLNFLSFYRFSFLNLPEITTDIDEIYTQSYIPITDFTYFQDQIYFTGNYTLYSYNINNNNLTNVGTTHTSIEFNNNLISGITSVPICQKPMISFDKERAFCEGNTYFLDATFPNSEYLWQDGSTTSSIEVTGNGIYSVIVTNECGSTEDSIEINFTLGPILDLGEDRIVCPGYILSPKISHNTDIFTWSNGVVEPSLQINESGIYTLTAENECGIAIDSVHITIQNEPRVYLGEDRFVCPGYILNYEKSTDATSFKWSNGVQDSSIAINESGTYIITVENNCGTHSDSVNITVLNEPIVELGEDRIVCPGYILSYKKPSNTTIFRWSNDIEDTAIVINKTGTYALTIENYCGVSSDSVYITIPELENLFIPNIITPNNDKKNEYFVLDERIAGSEIQIYNRYGRLVYENMNYKNKWNGNDLSDAAYYYRIKTVCNDIIKGWVEIRR